MCGGACSGGGRERSSSRRRSATPSATLTLTPFRSFCLAQTCFVSCSSILILFLHKRQGSAKPNPSDDKLNGDLTLYSMPVRGRHSSVDGGSRTKDKDKSSAHRRRHSSVAREETTRRRSSSGSRSGKQQSRRRSAEGGEGKGRRRRSAENERTQHSR